MAQVEGRHAADRRNHKRQPALLHRIDVVQHGGAVDAEVLRVAHTLTVETDDPMPPLASVKLCLNSPRLILWVTLLT